ncbi:MAG: hypothetical protein PHP65_02865, partial [Bacilli bacterium]|nr:hypothetical protein [Bacilli bacterium]
NSYGQLGDGTTTDRSTPTEITNQFNLGVGETIMSVSLGNVHSSALTSTGSIFTWGGNSAGQLGDGTLINKSTPTEITSVTATLILTDVYEYSANIVEYIPVLEGNTFSGWYSNIGLTTPYTFTIMPAEDVVLFGRWIPIN